MDAGFAFYNLLLFFKKEYSAKLHQTNRIEIQNCFNSIPK